jgi:hypothetical protein
MKAIVAVCSLLLTISLVALAQESKTSDEEGRILALETA